MYKILAYFVSLSGTFVFKAFLPAREQLWWSVVLALAWQPPSNLRGQCTLDSLTCGPVYALMQDEAIASKSFRVLRSQ